MKRGNPPNREAARDHALTGIKLERLRQIELWGEGRLETPLPVLVEEVGEVANAMQDLGPKQVYEELEQVAAVALRWMEDLLLEMER